MLEHEIQVRCFQWLNRCCKYLDAKFKLGYYKHDRDIKVIASLFLDDIAIVDNFKKEEAVCFLDAVSMLYAVPNGGKRDIRTANKLKMEGVKPGVWDLSMDYPCGGFYGLKIEMKTSKGRLTDKQKQWKVRYEKFGYKTDVATCLSEFRKVILSYLCIDALVLIDREE